MTYKAPPAGRAKKKKAPVLLFGEEELGDFILDIVDKDARDLHIRDSIIDGSITVGMDPAQIDLTVHDPERKIIKSGELEDEDGELRAVDLVLEGARENFWIFRLIKFRKQGDDVLITFEHRMVTWLRAKKGPRKAASRSKTTRAEYILRLIRSIKQQRIRTSMYQLHVKRKIADLSAAEKKRKARADRKAKEKHDVNEAKAGGGFDPGAYKKLGVTKGQLENMAVFLAECDLLGATDRPRLAGLCAGFGESNWSKAAVDWKYGTHKGVFQSNQIPPEQLDVQSHHFLVGGRSFLAGGAIGYAKANPGASPGMIAIKVEISDASGAGFYDAYRSKADRILAAWKGGSGGTTGSQADTSTSANQYYKQYQYKVDKGESYWDAIQRLASDVKWRAFFIFDTFIYWPETALWRQPISFTLEEGESVAVPIRGTDLNESIYCSNIDFDWDYRKEVRTVTATVRMRTWESLFPGMTVGIADMGPVSNAKANKGKWLLEEVQRPLFSHEATLSLSQPSTPRAEPRSTTATKRAKTATTGDGGPAIGSGKNAYVKTAPGNGDFKAQTTRPDGKRVLPNSWLEDFLSDLAGATGHTIYTNTYSRHNQFSTSHLQSDHWVGNGADLNVTQHGGNYPNPYGTKMAEEAVRLCVASQGGDTAKNAASIGSRHARGGGSYTRFTWKNPHDHKSYSVQVLWGPNVAHTDHVHIGVHPA